MRVWGYFMLGMYGDSPITMQRTIDFACELAPNIANFAISAPYPGTEWGEIAEAKGWLVDKRWEAYDQNYSAQVSQPKCDISTIRRFQKKAYLRWYFSSRGIRFLLSGFRPEYLGYFYSTIKDHLI